MKSYSQVPSFHTGPRSQVTGYSSRTIVRVLRERRVWTQSVLHMSPSHAMFRSRRDVSSCICCRRRTSTTALHTTVPLRPMYYAYPDFCLPNAAVRKCTIACRQPSPRILHPYPFISSSSPHLSELRPFMSIIPRTTHSS